MDNELTFWVASKSHTAMCPFKVLNGFKRLAASGKEPKQKKGRRESPAMQMSFSFIKWFLFKRPTEQKMPLISCDTCEVLHKSTSIQDSPESGNYWSCFCCIFAFKGARCRSMQTVPCFFPLQLWYNHFPALKATTANRDTLFIQAKLKPSRIFPCVCSCLQNMATSRRKYR